MKPPQRSWLLCSVVSVVSVVLMAAGCQVGAARPGAGAGAEDEAAIGRLALARLEREEACHDRTTPAAKVGAVEAGRRLDAARARTEAELRPEWCKSNVHPARLDACVSGIAHWPCDRPLEKVTAIESCDVHSLCGVPVQGTM